MAGAWVWLLISPGVRKGVGVEEDLRVWVPVVGGLRGSVSRKREKAGQGVWIRWLPGLG